MLRRTCDEFTDKIRNLLLSRKGRFCYNDHIMTQCMQIERGENMLEQAVAKYCTKDERRLRRFLRVLQVMTLTMLFLGEGLGLMLSQIYYQSDMTAFWRWLRLLGLFAVPALVVAAVLELSLRPLIMEYDYELHNGTFTVYKVIYGRRKWFFSFELNNIQNIGCEADEVSVGKTLKASCNSDSSRLTYVYCNNSLYRKGSGPVTAVLELDPIFREAFDKAWKGAYI